MARAPPSRPAARPGFVHRLYTITPEDRFERQPWVRTGRGIWSSPAGSTTARIWRPGLGWRRRPARNGRRRPLPGGARAMGRGSTGASVRRLCFRRLERARPPPAVVPRPDGRTLACISIAVPHLVAFATTIGALHALPDVPAHSTKRWSAIWWRTIHSRRAARCIAASNASGRARSIVCAGGEATMRRYWQPRHRALGLKTHADCRGGRARATRPRRGANAAQHQPVAVSASGGLDSSGVAATAARLLAPARLAAYTRVPPPDFDRAETATMYFNERGKVTALSKHASQHGRDLRRRRGASRL